MFTPIHCPTHKPIPTKRLPNITKIGSQTQPITRALAPIGMNSTVCPQPLVHKKENALTSVPKTISMVTTPTTIAYLWTRIAYPTISPLFASQYYLTLFTAALLKTACSDSDANTNNNVTDTAISENSAINTPAGPKKP